MAKDTSDKSEGESPTSTVVIVDVLPIIETLSFSDVLAGRDKTLTRISLVSCPLVWGIKIPSSVSKVIRSASCVLGNGIDRMACP